MKLSALIATAAFVPIGSLNAATTISIDAGNNGWTGWTQVLTSGNSSQNGTFLGTAANGSDITTTGSFGSVSWSLYANSGQTASRYYDLDSSLTVGQTLGLNNMDNPGIQNGGVVGISLQNNSGTNRFECRARARGHRRRRPGRGRRAHARRPAHRRPPAAPGRAGHGQDAAGQRAVAGHRPQVQAHPVHHRPAAVRHPRLGDPRPATASSAPTRGRSSPTCCWPTRSTAPRRRCRARCSRPCRSAGHHRQRRTRCPVPFLVIATQNPIEQAGTFELPEAQLDRFMLCHRLGYPTADPGGGSPAPPTRPWVLKPRGRGAMPRTAFDMIGGEAVCKRATWCAMEAVQKSTSARRSSSTASSSSAAPASTRASSSAAARAPASRSSRPRAPAR
jgi:hypothetical protein